MINKLDLSNVKIKLFKIPKLPCLQRKALWAAALLNLVVLAGCATEQVGRLPAVTSDTHHEVFAGKFVWIDLVTEDRQAASAFYQGLFGWRSQTSEDNADYAVFFKGDKPVGGMVAAANLNQQAPESVWLVSLSVEDVDRSAFLFKARGGKVVNGPVNAGARGRMALVDDPGGASLILLRAPGGDPLDTVAGTGEWLWTDLFTQDAQKAGAFYTFLAGYQIDRVEAKEGHQYNVLLKDGRPRAGIVELHWEGLKDNWLPYFRVDDLDRTIEIARQLGGSLAVQTEDAALLSDPTGAVFGIQEQAQGR